MATRDENGNPPLFEESPDTDWDEVAAYFADHPEMGGITFVDRGSLEELRK